MPKPILLILGRFNPLHIGHKLKVILPAMQQVKFDSKEKEPYIITVLGTCNEDRDLQKNPLNFQQRKNMVLITMSELLQTELSGNLSEDNRQKLQEHNGDISSIFDVDASFIAHYDSPKKNTPPSLDPLHERIVDHCNKYKIPTSSLSSFSTVKDGELGRAYQIEGRIYEQTSQLSAVARHLGFNHEQSLVHDDGNVISATNIRRDLSRNFISLSPRTFVYLQQEMALAHLNERQIGEDKSGDRVKIEDANAFISELLEKDLLLSFGSSRTNPVEVSKVELPYIDSLRYYHDVSKIGGNKEKPSAITTHAESNSKAIINSQNNGRGNT
jgi:hypothetical protein